METEDIARIPFFEGLPDAALAGVARRLRPRRFAAGEVLCRQGEPGESLFVIERGLARVLMNRRDGVVSLALLRRGDLIGEMSLVTGEPRAATVIAVVPTDVLELDRQTFTALLAEHPLLLANLSSILSRRLAQMNLRTPARSRRGEAIGLVITGEGQGVAAAVIDAARAADPHPIEVIDLIGLHTSPVYRPAEPSVEGALAALDQVLPTRAAAVVVAGAGQENLALLLEQMDRTIVLGDEPGARELLSAAGAAAEAAEVVLVTQHPHAAPRDIAGRRVVRTVHPAQGTADTDWVGRHLSRTKLGLALGAGGAKGYAHIGVLHALQEAGYTVDYVSGSSIGALIGAWLALGRDAAAIEETMRHAFTPEVVAATFKLSLAGTSTGLETMTRILRGTTEDRTFADLLIPLVVMTVDLNSRLPAPLTDGPLWQALQAATALAGLFPPVPRDGQRLVDGLALVPVPAGAVIEAGADVTVSVNLISRDTLDAWPGEAPPEPQAPRGGARVLDLLMEVMDLAQLDASVRHASLADVPITPRFGPASWRDFHLADLFLAAGRAAAEASLSSLQALARPLHASRQAKGEAHGTAIHVQ